MAIKFEKKTPKQAKATTTTAIVQNKEVVAENVEQEVVTDTPAIKSVINEQLPVIHVALGQTINLGNFQSARVDVGLSIPCGFQEIDKIYDWAETWVNDKVKAVSDALTATSE